MPKSEQFKRVEQLLEAHRCSDPPGRWWFHHEELLELLAQAGDQCLLALGKTLECVGGSHAPGADVTAEQLSNLDEFLLTAAFGILFDRERPALRKTVAGVCRRFFKWQVDDNDIDDSLNQIWCELLTCRELIRHFLVSQDRAKFRFHARRAFGEMKKFWHRDRKASIGALTIDPQAPVEAVDAGIRTEEIWEVLEKADGLSDGQKQLIELKFLEELTIRQIANRIGTSNSTANDRVAAATNLFRGILRDKGIDPY